MQDVQEVKMRAWGPAYENANQPYFVTLAMTSKVKKKNNN